MKVEMKMLAAVVIIFAIATSGLIMATETDAVDVGDEVDEEFIEKYTIFDMKDDNKVIFKYKVSGTAELTDLTIQSGEINVNNISVAPFDFAEGYSGFTGSSGNQTVDPNVYYIFEGEYYVMAKVSVSFTHPDLGMRIANVNALVKASSPQVTLTIKNLTFDNKDHNWSEFVSYSRDLVFDSGVMSATNAGSYTTYVKISGYESFGAIKAVWKILPRSITGAEITLEPTTFIKDGQEHHPDITVTYKFNKLYTLVEGKDYTVTFGKIVNDKQNATIVGKGNFTDSKATDYWVYIDPIEITGELHVNDMFVDGIVDTSAFDGQIFLWNGLNGPIFDRSCYTITVANAQGEIIILDDEPQGKAFVSNWNYIEINGKLENGYTGHIEGSFYAQLSVPVAYEIGSTFSEDSLVYTVTSLDNKTVSVTGYESGIQAGVAIPDYVDGFKVTKIGTKAFYKCTTITSVDLGENITSVGIKAFANCTKLGTVVFDDALKTIGAYAFYNCGKLTSIDLPDKVRTIGSYAFYKCNALTSVSFDDALKTVGTKAFTVSFENASGKVIKQTAKNLAGKTFEGSDKVLKLVA